MKTRPLEEKKTDEDNQTTTNEQNPVNQEQPSKENESENKIPEKQHKEDVETSTTSNNKTTASSDEQDFWTQIQQKCLEQAIQQFPKTTAERWTCISRAVPGKTKVIFVLMLEVLGLPEESSQYQTSFFKNQRK